MKKALVLAIAAVLALGAAGGLRAGEDVQFWEVFALAWNPSRA